MQVSRFEFEKIRHKDLTEYELEKTLARRGSDLQIIKKYHDIHKRAETQLIQALEKRGIETKVCQRVEYNDALVQWADVIFSAGNKRSLNLFYCLLLHHWPIIYQVVTERS